MATVNASTPYNNKCSHCNKTCLQDIQLKDLYVQPHISKPNYLVHTDLKMKNS